MSNLGTNLGMNTDAKLAVGDVALDAGASADLAANAGLDGVSLGADASGAAGASVQDVTAAVGGGLDGALAATPDGAASAEAAGGFDAMLDALGELFAELGASVSAALGL